LNFLDSASSPSVDLRRQLAYLQSVVSSMPQGISVFDEKLCLRVWNQGFINVLSLPIESVREGVHFSDLIRIPAKRGEYGPGDVENHVARITALAQKFEAHCFERTRPNGHTHLVQGEPLFIEGQLAGFITTYTDITERKAVEVALQMQHNQLITLVESIPSAVSLFSKDEHLVLYNAEFLRLMNIPEDLVAPGCSLESLFRFNAQRGEYGPGDPEQIVLALLQRARNPTRIASSVRAQMERRWRSAAFHLPTAAL
jgi:PAS domain-containing protein